MAGDARREVRNLAIIAHVDHGKTTLVDAMLAAAETANNAGSIPEVLPPDREKRVPVMVKHAVVEAPHARIHVLDTPTHANFGGAVDRILRLVDGFLLVVDACEGPLPRTRFVLRRALEEGLAPVVVFTKVDRPEARPDRVLQEVRDLFEDLEASRGQLTFPVLLCDALRGRCRRWPDGDDGSVAVLFRTILDGVPAPGGSKDAPLRFLVTDLDYEDFPGRLALGRVFEGTLRVGDEVLRCRHGEPRRSAVIQGIYGVEGLQRVELTESGPGEIVAVSGVEAVAIGDTLASPSHPEPLRPVRADEPTLMVDVSVNDSPTAAAKGRLASPDALRERLWKEMLTNVSVRVEETGKPGCVRVLAPGELHLVILFEMMRREGHEFLVSRPKPRTREDEGVLEEPLEDLVVDFPEPFAGVVGQRLEDRGARVMRLVNHGTGRVRLEARIPSRGLIGFRSEFLNNTRGAGILNHVFSGYRKAESVDALRETGVLVADRPGRATSHAIAHLQSRGTMFVAPGDEVYEGLIVGENSRAEDVSVNVTKERRVSPERGRSEGTETALLPPRSFSLEEALEFIDDGELVEVTPVALRLRKADLRKASDSYKS